MEDLRRSVQAEKSGVRTEEELTQLIDWIKGEDSALALQAAKSLVKFIHTPEDEQTGEITTTTCCAAITARGTGCLEALLNMAMTDKLKLHCNIKKSELTMGEMIGRGRMSFSLCFFPFFSLVFPPFFFFSSFFSLLSFEAYSFDPK
eukprot:TRINITY_DN1308_c0_g3_i1.p1 TRINITY_DN1308_c0_g3~~TRINITY_DN1308_c0_g3_i1.p1  ORF type:complete len:164 (-),score=47.16 TRINITY_DN1308_c0_g3_i1:494-934(-)